MTERPLAQLLRGAASPPEGQEAEAWKKARAVLLEEAPPDAAETLPETLLLALLEALVEERRTSAVEALAASPNKHTAKAARRAQYRLRSAGVQTRTQLANRPAAAPEPEARAELPSLLSLPDGAGERVLMVARGVKGGLALHEVVFSDELGLLAHHALEGSRSAWRRSLRDARAEPLQEISLDEARGLLAEALRCNLATRSPLPKGAEEMLRRLDVVPATAPPPLLPVPEAGDATLALEGERLHEEPELRGWLPPEDELKLFAARVQEVRTSPLALSEQQRAEQLLERTHAMALALFTPARATVRTPAVADGGALRENAPRPRGPAGAGRGTATLPPGAGRLLALCRGALRKASAACPGRVRSAPQRGRHRPCRSDGAPLQGRTHSSVRLVKDGLPLVALLWWTPGVKRS